MSDQGRDGSCCHPNEKIPSERGSTCPYLALELLSLIPPCFRIFLQWIPPVLSPPWLLVRLLPCTLHTGNFEAGWDPSIASTLRKSSCTPGDPEQRAVYDEPLAELLNEPAAHFAEENTVGMKELGTNSEKQSAKG